MKKLLFSTWLKSDKKNSNLKIQKQNRKLHNPKIQSEV